MKRWMASIAVILALLSGALADPAGADTLTYYSLQTELSGDSYPNAPFIYTFNGVRLSDGSDGQFNILARGDYSINFPHVEYLTWDIDGLASGTAAPAYGTVIQGYLFDDIKWTQTFTIPGATMIAITADGMATLTIQLAVDQVDHFNPTDFVQGQIYYQGMAPQVPLPSTVLLLGSGLLRLACYRRKLRKG
jgi:hypothetical protein